MEAMEAMERQRGPANGWVTLPGIDYATELTIVDLQQSNSEPLVLNSSYR